VTQLSNLELRVYGGVMVSTGEKVVRVASRGSISPQYGGKTLIANNNELAYAA